MPCINKHSNQITSTFLVETDRYRFDFELCSAAKGWTQYDTTQDAWYFGVWVHPGDRRIITYAEGDLITVNCPTPESFQAELASMAEVYGPPPPAFVGYDTDRTRTEFYTERPTGTEQDPP